MRLLHALLPAVVCIASCAKPDPAARAAADAWLALVDDARYADSYADASEPFRRATTAGAWEKMATAVRAPLGKVKSRTLKSATPTKSVPGAPEGEYVIILFDTSFEHKDAIETVTPMKEADGKWRVSGYYIR